MAPCTLTHWNQREWKGRPPRQNHSHHRHPRCGISAQNLHTSTDHKETLHVHAGPDIKSVGGDSGRPQVLDQTPATCEASSAPYQVRPVRTTFRTQHAHSPLSPQAPLQLLASLELVAMKGDAPPPPRRALHFKASAQDTHMRAPPLRLQRCRAALKDRAASPLECCMLRVSSFDQSCTHWGFQPEVPSKPNLVWPNGASSRCSTGRE